MDLGEEVVVTRSYSEELQIRKGKGKKKDSCKPYQGYEGYRIGNNFGILIVWFFIIFVITWLALYALKPTFITRGCRSEVDSGKALLAAAVIAFIIVLVIWLIKVLVQRFGCK